MRSLGAFHVLAALGVISSITLIAGLFSMTSQMDQQQRAREELLVHSQLGASIAAGRRSIQSMARSDDAIVHLDHVQDANWARRMYGTKRAGQIWPYVISFDGRMLLDASPPGSELPFEHGLGSATRAIVDARHHQSPDTAIVYSGAFWSGRTPYLLFLGPIVPSSDKIALRHSAPPILAAVTPLRTFLMPHFSGTGVAGLAVRAAALPGEDSIPVPGLKGRPVAVLVWHASRPGSQLRSLTLIPLLTMVGLFITTVFYAYRRGIISARRLVVSEANATTLAFHDQLTGLPNRRSFIQHLTDAIEREPFGNDELKAVMLIDLDRFKTVNDTYGHQTGDELLREVANRLRSTCGPDHLCARLGGDEFVVLAGCTDADGITTLARRVLASLSAPASLQLAEINTACSIGISTTDSSRIGTQMMSEADLALYRAKEDGRGAFRLFDPEMEHCRQRQRALEADLRSAIDHRTLEVAYQPQFRNGRMVMVEALVRWRHPIHGDVGPDVFVPLAEEIGLIGELGRHVMRRAFQDSLWWQGVRVAINVSGIEVRKADFVDAIRMILAKEGVAASNFELELTEGVLLADDRSARNSLSVLQEMGFTIALDDFGTGYSSLCYLHDFPVDKIKIDKSFVSGLPNDRAAVALTRLMIQLGIDLDLDVLAEGVETETQFLVLEQMGCQSFQGYFFGHPVPAEEIDRLLVGQDSLRRGAA